MFEKLTALFGKGSKELQTKRRIAAKLHDTPFKYISEKDEKNELCATVGTKTIFRLTVDEMNIWEFMSLDGCVITFVDLDTGKERTVTVYYEAHLS